MLSMKGNQGFHARCGYGHILLEMKIGCSLLIKEDA